MVEEFSAASEIRKVKNGLIAAITTVNLKADGTSPEDQPGYESAGKGILDYLASGESLIHQIRPNLMEDYRETIEKAKQFFPNEESLLHLQKLLDVV